MLFRQHTISCVDREPDHHMLRLGEHLLSKIPPASLNLIIPRQREGHKRLAIPWIERHNLNSLHLNCNLTIPEMSRKTQRLEWLEPIARCVVLADDQHRLNLPVDIAELIAWLPHDLSGPIECLAVPNGKRGLLVTPSGEEDALTGYPRALRELEIPSQAGYADWFDAVRLIAASWPLTVRPVSLTGTVRYRLQPPEGLRNLGLAPAHGQSAHLLICKRVLELWTGDNWVNYTQGLAARRRQVLTTFEDEFEGLLDS